jgi:hypothetical protein
MKEKYFDKGKTKKLNEIKTKRTVDSYNLQEL